MFLIKASESVATAEVRQVVNVDATRVNQAAFCVTTGLALATAGSVYAVVTAAAMTTQFAFGISLGLFLLVHLLVLLLRGWILIPEI